MVKTTRRSSSASERCDDAKRKSNSLIFSDSSSPVIGFHFHEPPTDKPTETLLSARSRMVEKKSYGTTASELAKGNHVNRTLIAVLTKRGRKQRAPNLSFCVVARETVHRTTKPSHLFAVRDGKIRRDKLVVARRCLGTLIQERETGGITAKLQWRKNNFGKGLVCFQFLLYLGINSVDKIKSSIRSVPIH